MSLITMNMAGSATLTPAGEPSSPGREENRLVERFVRGDAGAFDQIVELYQHRIARLASRLLGWPSDVDDVVQEVFLAIFKNLDKFRHQNALNQEMALRIAAQSIRNILH